MHQSKILMKKLLSKVISFVIVLLVGCQQYVSNDAKKVANPLNIKKGVVNTLTTTSTTSNDLLAFAGNGLYSVNSFTMAVTQLPWTWDGTTAAVISNGNLFAIQYGELYKLNLSNYQIWDFGHYWDGANLMTADDAGNIYVIQGAVLYRVNPNNGSWVALATYCDWTSSGDMSFTPYLFGVPENSTNLVILQYGEMWLATTTTGNCYDQKPDGLNNGPMVIPVVDTYYDRKYAYGIGADGSILAEAIAQSDMIMQSFSGIGPKYPGAVDITTTDTGEFWIVINSKLHRVHIEGNTNRDWGPVQLDNVYKVVAANGR